MKGLIGEWRALRAFNRLDPSFRRLVFYSEGAGDWPHIGPVVERILKHGEKVSYLTSDKSDPGLRVAHDAFRAFHVGSGYVRTILFRTIDCRHFVMTLPDLETFHLKRSVHPAHYVYLFHALNSTHTSYRKGAFDAYDTILCVGPHHVAEIRATEAAYGLKPKELIEHGSVKLDAVLAAAAVSRPRTRAAGDPLIVLLAPSWGECSLIEQPLGTHIIDALLRAGCRTVVRLHPMTVRRLPQLVRALQLRAQREPLFTLEQDMNALDSWTASDVMISDWSGAASEYAFSLLKPVVFMDTPQKINNAEWQRIGRRAFEEEIRFEIGRVVSPADVASIPGVVEEMCRDAAAFRVRIAAARERRVFNVGRSAESAAAYLRSR